MSSKPRLHLGNKSCQFQQHSGSVKCHDVAGYGPKCRTHKAGDLIQHNKKAFTQLQANVVQRHETTDSKQRSNKTDRER